MVERSMYDAAKQQRRETTAIKTWIDQSSAYWDEVLDTDEFSGQVQVSRYPGLWFPVFNRIMPDVGGIVLVVKVGDNPVIMGPPPEEVTVLQIAPDDIFEAEEGRMYRIIDPLGVSPDRIVTVATRSDQSLYYADVIKRNIFFADEMFAFWVDGTFRGPGSVGIGDYNEVDDNWGQFPLMRVAVDALDNILITNSRHVSDTTKQVFKHNAAGTRFATLNFTTGTGAGQFGGDIKAIEVSPAGNLLLGDSNLTNARVLVFTSAGVYAGVYGGARSATVPPTSGLMWSVDDVATDSLGFVYVADMGSQYIHKFNVGGTLATRQPMPVRSGFASSTPHSLTVDLAGNVYVTDIFSTSVACLDSNLNLQYWMGEEWFGEPEETPNGWFYGELADVNADRLGNVYVLDSYFVHVFFQGQFVSRFRPTYLSALGNEEIVQDMALSNGRFYGTIDNDMARVLVYEVPGVGVQGPVGPQGDLGPPGPAGRPGPSLAFYNGEWEGISPDFMSPGSVKGDTNFTSSITEIYIHELDIEENDVSPMILSWDDLDGYLRIESQENPETDWMLVQINGSVSYASQVYTIPVEFIALSGAPDLFEDVYVVHIPSGPQGDTGATGDTGPQGPVGRVGPSASVYSGIFEDDTGESSMANGSVRGNNANLSLATALYISEAQADGSNVATMLNYWNSKKGTVRIESLSNPNSWIEYEITNMSDEGAYRDFQIAAIGGTVTSFTDLSSVYVSFQQRGPQGEQGIQGQAGPGTSGRMRYNFLTATTSGDPGTGNLKTNHATPSSATIIRINNTDLQSVDQGATLDLMDDSTSAIKGRIRLENDFAAYVDYQILSVSSAGTYREVTVQNGVSAGSIADGDDVWLTWVRTGDKGDTGAAGGVIDVVLSEQFATAGASNASTSVYLTVATISTTLPAGTWEYVTWYGQGYTATTVATWGAVGRFNGTSGAYGAFSSAGINADRASMFGSRKVTGLVSDGSTATTIRFEYVRSASFAATPTTEAGFLAAIFRRTA